MNLIDILDIKKSDITTIVGAGGKSSLMYSASSLLKKDYKILVTTTTHIYIPVEYQYDKLIMLEDLNEDEIKNICRNSENGIYVIGNNVVNNEKIKGLTFEQLDRIIDYFDYIFIEGDGSKRKPLKGWNKDEPVIYPRTTKTIGILDIKSIGLPVDEEHIHRVDKFKELINYANNEKVTIENLLSVVFSKKGLFKNSKGKRILLINKVENKENKKYAIKLIKDINSVNKKYIKHIVYGSIWHNKFYR